MWLIDWLIDWLLAPEDNWCQLFLCSVYVWLQDLLAELNIGPNKHRIARLAIMLAMDRHNAQRELTSQLISDLYRTVFCSNDIAACFSDLLSSIDDIVLDTPDAHNVTTACILYQLLCVGHGIRYITYGPLSTVMIDDWASVRCVLWGSHSPRCCTGLNYTCQDVGTWQNFVRWWSKLLPTYRVCSLTSPGFPGEWLLTWKTWRSQRIPKWSGKMGKVRGSKICWNLAVRAVKIPVSQNTFIIFCFTSVSFSVSFCSCYNPNC